MFNQEEMKDLMTFLEKNGYAGGETKLQEFINKTKETRETIATYLLPFLCKLSSVKQSHDIRALKQVVLGDLEKTLKQYALSGMIDEPDYDKRMNPELIIRLENNKLKMIGIKDQSHMIKNYENQPISLYFIEGEVIDGKDVWTEGMSIDLVKKKPYKQK